MNGSGYESEVSEQEIRAALAALQAPPQAPVYRRPAASTTPSRSPERYWVDGTKSCSTARASDFLQRAVWCGLDGEREQRGHTAGTREGARFAALVAVFRLASRRLAGLKEHWLA